MLNAISQASLKDLSHFKTGGLCQELYCPQSKEELAAIVRHLATQRTPYFLLGAGSNSLVCDEPWPGAVISFHKMTAWQVDSTTLACEAGVSNTQLADVALRYGLGGLAWMYRLPGQMGATVRMNARCYGGEISQVVRKVVTVTAAGELKTYHNPAGAQTLFKGYKDTIFMRNGELVAAAELELTPAADVVALKRKMEACEQDRLAKQQFLHPNCGCVFKNDYADAVGVASGLLLELAGVKGMSQGQAQVSPYHCNFIYNQGASSHEILELSFAMREAVWQEFGVWLAYEMEVLGALADDFRQRFAETRPPAYKTQKLERARTEFRKRLNRSQN